MKLSRQLLLATAALTFLVAACSQPNDLQSPTIESQFGASGNELASDVAVSSAHPYVFVASLYRSADLTSSRVVLRRYNRDGSLAWDRRSAPLNYSNTQVGGVGTDTAGNAYIAYSSAGGGAYEADKPVSNFLSKTSKKGALLWRVDLQNTGSFPEGKQISYTQALATDKAGNTYVAVSSYNFEEFPLKSLPAVLRKYNTYAELVWERTLEVGEEFSEGINDLAVATDGSLYALVNLGFSDFLVKYTSRGTVSWRTSVRTDNYIYTNVTVGGNTVYLGGEWTDPHTFSRIPAVAKYDTAGTLQWEHVFARTPTGYGSFRNITADTSGNVYVATSVSDASNTLDLLVRKLRPTSGSSWSYSPKLPGTYDEALNVAVRSTGEIYAVGATDGRVNGRNFGSLDAFLLRLNGQGQKVWSR